MDFARKIEIFEQELRAHLRPNLHSILRVTPGVQENTVDVALLPEVGTPVKSRALLEPRLVDEQHVRAEFRQMTKHQIGSMTRMFDRHNPPLTDEPSAHGQ